jgi:hypothetical protein
MWAGALRHAGVVGELTALQVAVSSAVELMLGRSPDETSRVEVMNELAAKFWRLEDLCSRLEGPDMRICSLLLMPPPGQARWVDYLEEVAGRLEMTLAERHQTDTELEALQTSTVLVQDLVLGKASEPSSPATSLSMVAEEVEIWINTMAANRVRCETQSVLVAVLLHFPELKSKLELLRSKRNADLSDDQVDALWPLASMASDSLTSLVPSPFAHNPPDGAEE